MQFCGNMTVNNMAIVGKRSESHLSRCYVLTGKEILKDAKTVARNGRNRVEELQ